MTYTEQTPSPAELSLNYLLAILTRDSATLQKSFKFSKDEVAAITPEQQTAVAIRILANGNTKLRSQSKRIQAAEAGLVKVIPPVAVTSKPTFNPTPFSTPRVA